MNLLKNSWIKIQNIVFMKISISQKLFLYSLIIIAGNGFMGYSVYKSNQKFRESEQLVQHSEKVISQSFNILSLSKDVEIASRGFIITNDSSFLESYINPAIIFVKTQQLKQLLQNDIKQQQRVDSLIVNLQNYLDFSNKAIQLRSEKGLAVASSLISTKLGKKYIDRICMFTDEIQLEETRLLKERKLENEYTVAVFSKISAVMFLLMTIFTILLLVVIGKNLLKDKQKKKREEEFSIANKELDFQNEEKEKRAAELFIANKELDFQNEEKEKRAAELVIADKEVIIQHQQSEKQEAENKELEAFSYSVSHDLRAPLRHIGGFVNLLIKNNSSQLDATGLRYLNIISESSHEMGNLIDALLSFSRLGRTGLNRTTIHTIKMVNNIINSFNNDLIGRNIEIKISELPPCYGDEVLINQVWVNLISNAIKYSKNKEKTIIKIDYKTEKDKTIFSINDNGAGFDMLYADKLFGVFQRLHKARDFEGIGIGLANVKRIIVRHGGTVWAESELNKGATFYLSLPNK